jgi:quinoprotein glucose dehydrogenase
MPATRRFSWGLFVVILMLVVVVAGAAYVLFWGGVGGRTGTTGPVDHEWTNHGGDPGHRQFSPLTQITRDNVHQLQVAWTYSSGDAREDNRSQIQCNPVVVHGVLYATSAQLKTFALEAATGRELWVFDPFAAGAEEHSLGVNRGVAYWEEGDERRILVTAGERLYALDARTGRPIPTFGTNGSVNIKEGLGRDVDHLYVLSNTPGAIYKDLLILGTRVSEGPGPSAPGHVRAYDVRTGAIRWRFNTIPYPGEFGYETWPPDAWTRVGGTNPWSGISVDRERGLVFLPIGSAAFDFWGGNRHGENLFANTVLVLKADTGERAWHYQIVRHDLWDRDPPAAPVLVRVTRDGREIDAVAQVAKSGHVWVFNRDTGEPLFPIEERKVPPSDLKGEQAWPTQPLPLAPPPFARQHLTEDLLTDISPESRAAVLETFKKVRSGDQFTPPSTQGTVIFPGFDGGGEWGGSSWDQATGRLYVNSNEMPWILTMVELKRGPEVTTGERLYQVNCAVCHGADRRGDPQKVFPPIADVAERLKRPEVDAIIEHGRGVMPSFGTLTRPQREAIVGYLFGDQATHGTENAEEPDPTVLYSHTGYNRFLDPEGYPAVKPPWGTLNAINLNTGTIDWTVTLGELPELTARGIPPTGTENYGGPVATAGGVIFIGATRDEKFRAFDKDTGTLLWETSLPAGGYATPAVYSVNGKQFVVIAAGGGKMGTKSGDTYVAFALPDE